MEDFCSLCFKVVAPQARGFDNQSDRMVVNGKVCHKTCLLKHLVDTHKDNRPKPVRGVFKWRRPAMPART